MERRRGITVPSVLPEALAHWGVALEDMIDAIHEELFWITSDQPKRFRSSGIDPPSGASGNNAQERKVAMPEGMPYVAGFISPHWLCMTAIHFSPQIVWYSAPGEAKLVLTGSELPRTLRMGMAGMRLRDVVDHPGLAGDVEIIAAHASTGSTQIRLTNPMVGATDRRAGRHL